MTTLTPVQSDAIVLCRSYIAALRRAAKKGNRADAEDAAEKAETYIRRVLDDMPKGAAK